MTETQHRFLKAIAERLGERPVVEVRLFPAIRQGQHESGVAVVAVEEPLVVPEVALELEPEVDAGAGPPQGSELPPADEAGEPIAEELHPAPASSTQRSNQHPARATSNQHPPRLSILTARFRLTVKGPDRGKWEFDLVHDADAPIETIEPVVRGVARRVGEAGEPDLLSPAAFHRAVTEPWWTATA